MNRLTKTIKDAASTVICLQVSRRGNASAWRGWNQCHDGVIQEALLRLAAYEDTGLTPKEIRVLQEEHDFYNKEDAPASQRLVELALADKEGRCVVLPETDIGDMSDGYHTFNELYHHRAVLFSVICNLYATAWKSKLHHDGTMFDGMFIVGVKTPYGQATYHYDVEPYWDMFTVPVLERAPEWDGHTPEQAIERIGKLGHRPRKERS